MKNFVVDKYFSKGHYFVKFYQTFLGLFMWILVFIPIAITFKSVGGIRIPFLHQWYYLEGFNMFHDTLIILILSILLVGGVGILLTIKNNSKIKHQFKKKITYDSDTLNKKLILLEQTYTERFGEKTVRENTQFYSVQPNQNIDADYVQKLFENEEVT